MAKMGIKPEGDEVRQHHKIAAGGAPLSGNFGVRSMSDINGGSPSAEAPTVTGFDAGGGESSTSSIAGQIPGKATNY